MRLAKESLISLSNTPLMNAFLGWISGRSISGILFSGQCLRVLERQSEVLPFSPFPPELKIAKVVCEPIHESVRELHVHRLEAAEQESDGTT